MFNLQPLPELTRVKDLKISGSAFADLCMVQEFLHNFGPALDIGKFMRAGHAEL